MAPRDDPRPSEPSPIITAIWHTSAEETCIVKGEFTEQIQIYGALVNVFKLDHKDWQYKVPPNHTCTIMDGKGVTFIPESASS